MIEITIPDNNHAERTYILEVLFGEYLELSFQIQFKPQDHYHLQLANGHQLLIQDHFFNQYPKDKSYLSKAAIPQSVKYISNSFCPEQDIPILFGTEELVVEAQKINCGNDFFAAAFFMLTRWEEYTNPARDTLNRFASKDSLAAKHHFLDRPIVNEYLEMLWAMLQHLGIQQKRKKQAFSYLLTHDVDIPRLWPKASSILKTLGGSLLKRKSFDEANYHLKNYKQKLGGAKDPFDTFDYLMDLSEQKNIQSHFFFMSGGVTTYDNFYKIKDPHIVKLLQQIHERGHQIGIHPSFNAFNQEEQFAKELKALQEVSPQAIKTGRQHFLRFSIPDTWQIWENQKMEWDSTLSYADRQGFRCGTCLPFPVFNSLTRKKLKLIERPLIVMDGSYVSYQETNPEAMLKSIQQLISTVQKYKGEFVLLWHNSAFHAYEWRAYKEVYAQILASFIHR